MIDPERLNIFIQVAKTLSFSETAKRIHLSQSTVSKKIRELEAELNAELFHRKPGNVQLTEAGQTLLPWAQKLVRDSLDIRNIMESLKQEYSGHLNIACSTTSGKYVIPHLAVRFRKKNPNVRISILPCSQDDITHKLLAGEADMGIASVEMNREGLECQLFFMDQILLLAPVSHPWTKRAFIEPDELLDEPILLRENTSGTYRVMQAALAKHDISIDDLNILLEVGNAEAIVLLISSGVGISFVSKPASSYARKLGFVSAIPVKGVDLQHKICIGRKLLGSPNRARDAFWNFIHAPENAELLQLKDY